MTDDYGRLTGSREPDPSCTGSGPSGFDPERKWIEFRPDSRGEFDEICATFADGSVHVEMMSDKSCYVGFYWDDGRYCQWWFGTNKGKLWNNHDHGHGEPPRYTAQGVDTKPHLPDYTAIAMETRRAETVEHGSVAKP